MVPGREIENSGAASRPGYGSILETRSYGNVPDHLRISRLGIDIDVKELGAPVGDVDTGGNEVGTRYVDRENCTRPAAATREW